VPSSGIATITVDASGHNCIILVPGANDLMTPAIADARRDAIVGAKVLLTQLEVSLDATVHAMRLAKQQQQQQQQQPSAMTTPSRTKVFFNPAPAVKSLQS
jgi:ribokinase